MNRMHMILATAFVSMLMPSLGCDDKPYDGSAAADYEVSEETLALAAKAAQDNAQEKQREVAREAGTRQWDNPPAMEIDAGKDYTATFKTNHGEITVDLFEKYAPKTVNNFVFLAGKDFYDGVIFHRIIDNFMIQGGDPTGTGRGGPGYQFEDETANNPNKHEKYTLSMANAGPNTNGSQFFITDTATPHLDGKHTVFGKVTDGQDVVEEISQVRTAAANRPVEDVVIEDIVIMVDGKPMNAGDNAGDDAGESDQDAATTQPAE